MSGLKKNVVFQGGGAKGAALAYAVSGMVDQGALDLKQVQNYAGTSAGAICATLFSFGMEPKEVLNLMQATDFKTFMDGKSMDWLLKRSNEGLKWYKALSDAINAKAAYSKLMTDQGLCNGDVFRAWIEAQIKKLVSGTYLEHKKNITFADLHQLVQEQPLKGRHFADVFVVGSNVNTQQTETFSYQNTPNMCIADAVRISMSIPGVYKPAHRFDVDKNGARYQVNSDFYVDGGMHTSDNLPIDTFDKKGVRNPETVGFALLAPEDYAAVELHDGKTHRDIKTPSDFFGATFSMLEESRGSDRGLSQGLVMDPRAVVISTGSVGTLDFALTKEQHAELKAHAQIAVQEFQERAAQAPMTEQLQAYEKKMDPAKAELNDTISTLKKQIEDMRKAQEVAARTRNVIDMWRKPLADLVEGRDEKAKASTFMTSRLFSAVQADTGSAHSAEVACAA